MLVLRHFDPDLSIGLHTDVEGFVISGIVSQLHDLHWHPVAFYSCKCTPAECNYDIHDRELLAVVESMRYWYHYLERSRNLVQVLSDHDNLKIFMSSKALSCLQVHWAKLLANYDFLLIPIPGTKNPADGPSHRPDYVLDIPVPIGALILPNSLCLLSSNFTNFTNSTISNALFASIVGGPTIDAPEGSIREQIISSYPTNAVVSQHITNL